MAVRVGDAAGLRERIEVLAMDSTLRSKLGAANRARIINDFSAEKIFPQWIRLIEMS